MTRGPAGTAILLRSFLRRDRVMIAWWVVGGALLYYVQAPSVDGLYATQAEFDRAAANMQGNAAFIAMAGPARALNTVGGQVAWQATAFGAVVAGLMSMFLVARHTRAEEESGRDELVRAAVVGRHAPMTAALVVAALANLLLGVLVAGSLLSYGLAVAGCVSLGVGVTLTGLLFSGTALVAAQLTQGTRAMYGVAGTVIGVGYALRAVGDVGNPVFSWLSPIGWYQAMHAFSGERWWPALLLLAATGLALAAAYLVFDRRDVGSGLLPDRPGPPRAGAGLHRALGLAWRLQRGSVLGWAAGMLMVGLSYGSIGGDVGTLIGDSPTTREMFAQGAGSLVDSFYATAIVMLALIASGFAISSALRPRGEEEGGRLEALLATALTRRGWLAGHATITVLGTVLVLLAAGLGLGVGFAVATGDGGAVLRLTLATLPSVAPVLVLAALAALLHGLAPRAAALVWPALLFCVVVMLFGPLLRLPAWLVDVSPFAHLALTPAEPFRWLPFVLLLVLASAGGAVGQVLFTRRDVR